jgi:hypothetical protein
MVGRLEDRRKFATWYDRCPKAFPPAISHVAVIIDRLSVLTSGSLRATV